MKKTVGLISIFTLLGVLLGCTAASNTVDAFDILNRRDNHQRIAYVDGDHWHGSLPSIEEGQSLSLGATIVVEDETLSLDASGLADTLSVRLAEGAQEGIVSFAQYGDHVHIIGVNEGSTDVVFVWSRAGEEQFVTPPIGVTVTHDDDHHDHDHSVGEIQRFEILDRSNNAQRVAYIHGEHWHGSLPIIPLEGRLSLGAIIASVDGTAEGRLRELSPDGSHNGFTVQLAAGAPEGIVDLVPHGDHVHIRAVAPGTTRVVFSWTHDNEVRYTTPSIAVTVGDDHDDHDHD